MDITYWLQMFDQAGSSSYNFSLQVLDMLSLEYSCETFSPRFNIKLAKLQGFPEREKVTYTIILCGIYPEIKFIT